MVENSTSMISNSNVIDINVLREASDNVKAITFNQAEKELRSIILELKKDHKPIEILSFCKENEKILEDYWKKVYSIRDLKWPNDAKNELKRALSVLGSKSLRSISQFELQKLINNAYTNHPNNHRRMTFKIISLLNFIEREDITLQVRKKEFTDPKYLTDVEFLAFQRNISNEETKVLSGLAFYSGCRVGELYALDQDSLISNEILSVKTQIDKNGTRRLVKNRKPRTAFLRPEGVDYFNKWIAIKDKCTINRNEISKEIKKYAQKTFNDPRKHICFHDLRHSYAKSLLSKGVNISLVALSLGNSVQVCQEYYTGFTLNNDSLSLISQIVNKKH